MKQIQHLAPLHGLNPVNVAEEVGLEGTWMRGGYNVEVIDAEWWCRHGLGQLDVANSIGSVLWRWTVSMDTDDTFFLVSNNYAVKVIDHSAQPGLMPQSPIQRFDFTYARGADIQANFTTGSVNAKVAVVNSGTMKMGQLIHVKVSPTEQIYRVTSPGTDFQLDRPWELATGPFTCNFYDALLSAGRPGGVLDTDTEGGCILFEQTASFAANQLGYTHPAVSAGSYIIIVSSNGYVACPTISVVSPTQVPVTSFVRETQLGAPTPVTVFRCRPGNYKDRLLVKAKDQRTLWYSRPLDFMQWHTGLQSLGGTPNFITLQDPTDPISGFANQADTCIVHRRSSQDILQPYGTGFKVTHNASGIGFWPPSSLVEIPTGHFGWSRYGPALFGNDGMQVLLPQIERMLASFWQSQRVATKVRVIVHDQNRRRLYCLLGFEAIAGNPADPVQRIVRHQDAAASIPQAKLKNFDDIEWYTRSPVLVVDYTTNEAWIEDHVGLCGGGHHLGQAYFFRYDGTVAAHPTGWSGQDYDVNKTNAKTPVEAMVETQWMAHGVPQRKALEKIYVLLRLLDVDMSKDEVLGDHFDPLRIDDLGADGDTLHLCTVEIMTDHTDLVRATADITVSVAEMRARGLEGNRMLPVCMHSITPRVAGLSFKYRFKNTLSAASAAAGYKQGSFRLVDMFIEFDVESDTRAAALVGGKP